MKELSIEEKTKRYDEAIEKAKGVIEQNPLMEYLKKGIEYIFPSLKENEDERIRKALIEHFNFSDKNVYYEINGIPHKKVIAWLEKQGQTFTKKDVDDAYLKGICDAKHELEKQGEQKSVEFDDTNAKKMFIKALEMVEEQNTKGYKLTDCDKNSWWEDFKTYCGYTEMQNSDDKVEPKFKIGDWVIDKQDIVHQIANVIENVTYHTYCYDIVGGGYFNDNTEGVRLWTIQDAKDGDVLITGNKNIFIFKSISGYTIYDYCGLYFGTFEEYPATVNGHAAVQLPIDYVPATKEQRDLLFKKIKESGYEWDVERKELKKIEQKPTIIIQKFRMGDEIKTSNEESLTITKIDEKGYWSDDLFICDFDDAAKWKLVEQKPAWSEEDERKIELLKSLIEDAKGDSTSYSTMFREMEELNNWLKSLKNRVLPQSRQEWSEDDENRINRLIAYFEDKESFTAEDDIVYANWLKSLKDRYAFKPSDEQMKALCFVKKAKILDPEERELLNSLYMQLKKLREE